MTKIDKLIISAYVAEKKYMEYYGRRGRFFLAKLLFWVLVWIWLLPILSILENNLGLNLGVLEAILLIPDNRISYFPILLVMYFVLNLFTLKVDEADAFLAEDDNSSKVKEYKRLFILLLVVGFAFLVIIARYNFK